MHKVFLDVGANNGQSLVAAMAPEFGFYRIHCFEPASACWPKLEALADPRVRIEPFGLWNQNGCAPLFQPGSKGAGIYKKDTARTDTTEVCTFVSASDWMRENIDAGDVVYMKLNCEGAECDILDDLLDFGEFDKVNFIMVDFDVRKIAAHKHREQELRARLAAFPFPRVAFCKDVMRGETHELRIKNWLRLVADATAAH